MEQQNSTTRRYVAEICTTGGYDFQTYVTARPGTSYEDAAKGFITSIMSIGTPRTMRDVDGDWFTVRPEFIAAVTVEDAS